MLHGTTLKTPHDLFVLSLCRALASFACASRLLHSRSTSSQSLCTFRCCVAQDRTMFCFARMCATTRSAVSCSATGSLKFKSFSFATIVVTICSYPVKLEHSRNREMRGYADQHHKVRVCRFDSQVPHRFRSQVLHAHSMSQGVSWLSLQQPLLRSLPSLQRQWLSARPEKCGVMLKGMSPAPACPCRETTCTT